MRGRLLAVVACAAPATLTWWMHTAATVEPPVPRPAPAFRIAAQPTLHISAFERGIAAYNVDDLETAMDAFEEAVRATPEEPEAHINLGLVYLRLQRPDDALRELTQAAESRQHHTRPRRNRCRE